MLAALLSASGGHWIALQSLAWGTMLVDYGRASGFREAVSKTFDGQHPCALCKSIQKNSASEKKSGAQVAANKVDLFWQRGAAVFAPRASTREYPPFLSAREVRTRAPLFEPPRALPG